MLYDLPTQSFELSLLPKLMPIVATPILVPSSFKTGHFLSNAPSRKSLKLILKRPMRSGEISPSIDLRQKPKFKYACERSSGKVGIQK